MSDKQVTATELHTPTNSIVEVKQHLAPGVDLTDRQAYHVGVVLDIFQAKGTASKLNDAFSEDAVYVDKFAECKNREEIGMSSLIDLRAALTSEVEKVAGRGGWHCILVSQQHING